MRGHEKLLCGRAVPPGTSARPLQEMCIRDRYGHVLKNAISPVVTFFAMVIAEILAGSSVAEQVFSVPGIGRLLISSISNRDYPVVQAIVLYITSVVVLINFAVDMIYQVLDPRVRTAEE